MPGPQPRARARRGADADWLMRPPLDTPCGAEGTRSPVSRLISCCRTCMIPVSVKKTLIGAPTVCASSLVFHTVGSHTLSIQHVKLRVSILRTIAYVYFNISCDN